MLFTYLENKLKSVIHIANKYSSSFCHLCLTLFMGFFFPLSRIFTFYIDKYIHPDFCGLLSSTFGLKRSYPFQDYK